MGSEGEDADLVSQPFFFFFFDSLVPRIMRCDDHGLSRMNEGNSAPTIQLLLKQRFTIPSLCKFPRIESKHRGAVSHMATGGVCDDLSKWSPL